MPAITETYDSGKATDGKEQSRERRYVVVDAEYESDVLTLVKITAPTTLSDLRRGEIVVTPLGGGVWECTVPYDGVDEENESQWTFDTGGGTVHIAQSLSTVGKYSYTEAVTPPDFKGAIGVNGDNVAGTDITVPVFNFSETHRIPADSVTGSYKLALFGLTGRVNSASFKGFATGEVLFLGASGSLKGLGEWEICFKFAASPNVTNLQLGEITVAAKKGWEYLWVRFDDQEDGAAKTLVKRPIAAYVEKVYEYGNFSALGIGT